MRKLISAAVTYGTFNKALATNYLQQKRSWYMYFFQLPFAEHAVKNNDFAFIKKLWRDWSYKLPEEELKFALDNFQKEGTLKAALSYYHAAFNPVNNLAELQKFQEKIGTEKICTETLHLHGKEDGCLGVELCEKMNEYYSNKFELCIIEEAGHFLHLEKPEEFNQKVLDFISE